jgi:microcystin-dependent protein
MEGTMAVVTMVAYDFAPRYWASCNGQLLSIASNTALFSLLGTTYGGNGVQTFGLPDLRGRAPVSTGTSSLGSTYTLGEMSGSESITMTTNTMPPHTHSGSVSLALGASSVAAFDSNIEGKNIGSGMANAYSTNDNTNLAAPTYQATVGVAGSSQPFSILSPYLAVNFIICMQGIFPSRN